MAARVPSILFALLVVSFLLPWMSVSCSGQELLTASGLQLVTGAPESPMVDALGSMDLGEGNADSADGEMEADLAGEHMTLGSPWRLGSIIVLLCALVGLALSLRINAQPNDSQSLRQAVLGGIPAALLLGALVWGPNALQKAMEQTNAEQAASGDDPFGLGSAIGSMMQESVELEFLNGFWLALIAALAVCAHGIWSWRSAQAVNQVAPHEEAL